MVRDARSSKRQGTAYHVFETRREQKAGYVEGVFDPITGYSPITRWITQVFDYNDLDANFQAKVRLPANALLTGRAALLVNAPFDGTGANAANVGDEADADGWFALADLTQASGTVITAAGAYAGLFKRVGAADTIVATVGTAASTQGKVTLFVEAIAYCEDLDAEWNL